MRRERKNKSSILDRRVQGVFVFRTLCTLFYHCIRVGECRTVYVIDTFLLEKKEKEYLVHDFVVMFLLFSL